ncbi:hypothetical protein Anas_09062, partial [Armadillidium nasatum]
QSLRKNKEKKNFNNSEASCKDQVQAFQKVYNLSREMLDVDENKVMAELANFSSHISGLHFPTMFHLQHGGLVYASIVRYQK